MTARQLQKEWRFVYDGQLSIIRTFTNNPLIVAGDTDKIYG